MQSGFPTPVLLIVFNRLDTTRKVFEAIRKIRPSRLYIASDGPRDNKPGEDLKVQAVREYVMGHIDWECTVKTLFREKNVGCGLGPALAISWLFEHEEAGIILEDDCLPDASFFLFCQELLEKYHHDERVMIINGNNFLHERNLKLSCSYTFSKYNATWGWATWKRAWKYFDIKMGLWPQVRENNFLLSRMDKREYCVWRRHFDDVFSGKVDDVWDFQWLFACWSQNSLAISPTVNLVSNIGFGEDSTHTDIFDPRLASLRTESLKFPLIHPEGVIANYHADKLIRNTFYNISIPKYLWRTFKEKARLK